MQSGQRVFAKPVKGISFRKPNGEHIKEEGEEVIYSSFWKRRLADGDVTLSELPKSKRTDPAK